MKREVRNTSAKWRSRRAVILILSLWLVLVLSLLAYSLAVEMRVEMKLTRGYRDQFAAEQLARIGVARALTDLRNDRLMDLCRNEGAGEAFDALGDVWAGTLEPRSYDVEGVGRYEILVVDEESKLSLNSFNPAWREAMRNLLIFLKVDEKKAQDLADAIWDWKDSDNEPVGTQGDTEIAYYTELARKMAGSAGGSVSTVYPKNAPFDTVDELLQIPGMTPQIFYGCDPEEGESPEFFPVRSMRAYRKRLPGLRDLVTVRTQDLNLNTVGYEVLAAVCVCVTKNLDSGRSMAEKIITFRQGGSGSKEINNNHAFRKLEDLEMVTGFSGGFVSLMKQTVPELTIQSDHFTIYCQAEAGTKRHRIYSSGSARFDEEQLPSARVVAECERSTLVFEQEYFKKEYPPPGCLRQASQATIFPGIVSTTRQWFVPVTYVLRWISD